MSNVALKNKKNSSDEPAEIVYHWRIDNWFPTLKPETRNMLKQFHSELIEQSKILNLVSPKTLVHADVIHFADSILSSQLIINSSKATEMYDLGSGNGFPGLVMAIIYPNVKVHLVEQDQKKVEFLKHCIKKLSLNNATCLAQTVESLPPASVRYGMSRGFATISKSILAARKPFVKGGTYFHLKSEEWPSELAGIPTQLCTYWQPGLVGEYKLPLGEVKFAVVKTEKIAD